MERRSLDSWENGIVIMLIGYNTNVPYKGKVYHVQTEDSGLSNPSILTLLYCQGAILRSVKTGYAHIVGHPDLEEQVRDLMKQQHREMIRSLIRGQCDVEKSGSDEEVLPGDEEKGLATEAQESKAGACAKSLDEILLEHISRKVKK
jgi:hypothetical protein